MRTVHLSEKAGADGVLHLRIPVETAGAEYEAVVILQPRTETARPRTPEELGWPPGFFEQTAGSITDETFERPEQGELEERLDF